MALISNNICIEGTAPSILNPRRLKEKLSRYIPAGFRLCLNFGEKEIHNSGFDLTVNILHAFSGESKMSITVGPVLSLLLKPEDELAGEIISAVFCISNCSSRNPLTGLPGNRIIKARIEELISSGEPFSVAYFDLSDFKAYNEIYGFFNGDFVISQIARMALSVADRYSRSRIFIGHIGGDDFLAAGDDEIIRVFARQLCSVFDSAKEKYYTPEDFRSGFIKSFSREGEIKKFPLMSLNIVITVPDMKFNDFISMGEFATNQKDRIKAFKTGGRSCVMIADRQLYASGRDIRGFLKDVRIMLSAKKAFLEAIGELRNSVFEDALIELLKDTSLDYRLVKSIIYSLGRMCSKKAQEKISRLTCSDNAHIRTRSVEALANAGTEYRPLINKALYDRNNFVRQAAFYAIGETGGNEEAVRLMEIFPEEDRFGKEAIIDALGKIASPDVKEFLEKALYSEPGLDESVIRALSRVADGNTVGFLVRRIDRDESPKALANLLYVLEKKNTLVLGADETDVLFKHRNRFSAENRKTLIRIFGFAGLDKKEVFEYLRESVSCREKEVSETAFVSLRRFAPKLSLNFIGKYIKYKNIKIRMAAAEMLDIKHETAGIEMLRQMLKDSDFSVRRHAAESIINHVEEIIRQA